MPTILVSMNSGRTDEQVKEMVRLITDAVVTALGVARDDVTVSVRENT